MIGKVSFGIIALFLSAMLLCGVVSGADTTLPEPSADRLLIGTTTSLDATKLLDALAEIFEAENNVKVHWVSVGTGQALGYARACDVDIVMVHDRVAEDKFIDEGYGLDRRVFGSNYFLMVGPSTDPAGISGMSAVDAFKKIAETGAEDSSVVFVSRGDQSGTHSREKLIWKNAGYDYAEVNTSAWYREAGAGMGQTLQMTNELQGYTLSDSSSWATYESDVNLVPLIEGDDQFLNVYAVMRVNPDLCSSVNVDMGKKWINFMISDEVQDLISTYGIAEKGSAYFSPSRGDFEKLGVTEEETTKPVE